MCCCRADGRQLKRGARRPYGLRIEVEKAADCNEGGLPAEAALVRFLQCAPAGLIAGYVFFGRKQLLAQQMEWP